MRDGPFVGPSAHWLRDGGGTDPILLRDGRNHNAMYGNQPAVWSDQLQGPERWRLITNYLTRMRFCSAAGELELETKAAVTMEPPFKPWFLHPQKYSSEDKIVFGHWAALEGRHCADNIFALDTGCVWGGPLRLMDLDNQQYFHQSA